MKIRVEAVKKLGQAPRTGSYSEHLRIARSEPVPFFDENSRGEPMLSFGRHCTHEHSIRASDGV